MGMDCAKNTFIMGMYYALTITVTFSKWPENVNLKWLKYSRVYEKCGNEVKRVSKPISEINTDEYSHFCEYDTVIKCCF